MAVRLDPHRRGGWRKRLAVAGPVVGQAPEPPAKLCRGGGPSATGLRRRRGRRHQRAAFRGRRTRSNTRDVRRGGVAASWAWSAERAAAAAAASPCGRRCRCRRAACAGEACGHVRETRIMLLCPPRSARLERLSEHPAPSSCSWNRLPWARMAMGARATRALEQPLIAFSGTRRARPQGVGSRARPGWRWRSWSESARRAGLVVGHGDARNQRVGRMPRGGELITPLPSRDHVQLASPALWSGLAGL